MLNVILWHVLGGLLILAGASAIVGELIGLGAHGGPASLPMGCVMVALGAWAWVRGIRTRRARRESAA